jgi:hypothetical protein
LAIFKVSLLRMHDKPITLLITASNYPRFCLKTLTSIFVLVILASTGASSARADLWSAHVAPLFRENCTKCHGGAKQKGGLDLRTPESAMTGGDSGKVIHKGNPAESLLFQSIQAGGDPHMPPKAQLAPEEIELIGEWIEGLDKVAPAEPMRSRWTLPAGIDPTLAIDTFLSKSWHEAEITVLGRCDDRSFVRRIYLDLLGRIPTATEREGFLARTSSNKREELSDELLASKAHARHLAEVFGHALLGRATGKGKDRGEREKHLLPYLRWAFETERRWNQIARDMIVARADEPEARGAAWFLYEQRDDPNLMATATSAALLGKQVQCAQCHNHPIAPEIGQRHYHALVGFFSRTRNVQTPDGPALGEAAAGGYASFANLEGDTSEMRLEFLSGETVTEPEGKRETDREDFYVIAPPGDWITPPKPDPKTKKIKLTTKVDRTPTPKFSRRVELARVAIDENPDFAKAFVNRAWAILVGRGIVHPVDKMDSAHPPSHPEMLDWLAEDFANSGYRVRRLFAAIIGSRAYQAGTYQHESGARPQPASFAFALDKPLAAEPLYRSILVALGAQPAVDGTIPGETEHRGPFVTGLPTALASSSTPTVQYAMFVTNSPHLDRILRSEELPLVGELNALDKTDAIVERSFLTVLGRAPDSDDRQVAARFLSDRAEHKEAAIRQLLWALIAGAEFHTNH